MRKNVYAQLNWIMDLYNVNLGILSNTAKMLRLPYRIYNYDKVKTSISIYSFAVGSTMCWKLLPSSKVLALFCSGVDCSREIDIQ